jgi:hypothetical protein
VGGAESAARAGSHDLARCQAGRAGLGPLFAQPRVHGEIHDGSNVLSRGSQRVLGAARVRASAVADRGPHPWRRWIDTFLDSPHDIIEWERAPLVAGHTYRAEPRSVVILFAGLESEREN